MYIIKKSYCFPIILIVLILLSLATFNTESAVAEGEIVVIRGETITITAMLLQNGTYGNPIPNQKIFFFDQTYDTYLGSDKTNSSGIAFIEWNIPSNHTLGPTIINATFYGNESLSLLSSCQWIVLTILSSTNIEINQVPSLLAPGDTLSFLIHMIDDANNPISNATITVFKDSMPLAVNTTNTSGSIHFEIICNSSWITLGDNEIRVVYDQDFHNFLDSSEITFIIEIAKIPTSLTPQTPIPNEVVLNESIDLYIELSQENGSLANEFLKVFFDETFLLLTATNNSGIAHIQMNIDESFILGLHTLKIEYNGTERFFESTFEIPFSVLSPVQIMTNIPDSVDIGSNIQIEITVFDLFKRAIPKSLISIYDSTSNQRFILTSNSIEITTIFRYELQGPPGIHTLNIEITNNSFIMNTSSKCNFIAWSVSIISVINSNIEHYASPGQEIYLEIQMNDWTGNASFKHLQLLINNEIQFSVITDSNGQATFSFSVPYIEDQYIASILYNGNNTLFESLAQYDYSFQVTKVMPIRLELNFYEIIAPLHELSIQLTLRGFNGSLIQGVQMNFIWLDLSFSSVSTEGGMFILHLRVPFISGHYNLFYESETSKSVLSTNGSFLIEITIADIESLEGIGMIGLVIAIIVSVGVSSIPIIRRRYLLG
ncbi:MAG: hypothetical protein AM326_02115 [Candidatus Thorarchaeota archaeon SMTZ-45]|nr:MAG: hypothetical protein AM325_01140 [Candidatus Thorarchaeota archaeon SMTZ1-45]KXH76707.1 MAG: hypothetical protein AM326_02115 [Candidatus Thorarchaeota archaeon SMTZ-45]